jgi:hypothetical protein
MKMLPQTPEEESRLLGELYDRFIEAKGNTPEARRIANGIVNTIKGQWALTRAMQSLEREGKKADIDKDKALTALYRVQAALAPKQFALQEQKLALEREEFTFEKWYKTEQVKLGWARLELDKLIAEAKAAGTGEDTIKALKDLASAAKAFDDVAVNQLATRLRQMGHSDCADDLKKSGTTGWVEVVARNPNKCNEAVRQILTDRANHDDIIRVVENAVRFGQVVTEMAAQFVGGGPAQPSGTPQPSGAAPGGALSGTATPPTGDIVSGVRTKFNTLKQFGVQIPNDPKLAGAMVFVYGTESGPWYNPFEVKEGARVPMQEITIEEGGQKKKVKVPVGPDKGFQAVIDTAPGVRKKALAIDSAIAFGVAWIFPNEAENPGMLAQHIRRDFRDSNPGLFRRAENFKSKSGYVDMVSVAAAYADMSLEKLGAPIRHTKAYTGLLRLLAKHDLDMLRMKDPLLPEKAKQRFLNMVKSDNSLLRELIEAVKKRYPNLTREQALEMALGMAESLYDATRLSNIGNLVLGGGR